MHYQLLGPLRVEHAGQSIELGPRKQRAVLAALLLARGAVVSVDRLIDAVWGDDVPGSATASLQAYISNLRKALRVDGAVASPIVRQPPGYHLVVGEHARVDLVDYDMHCAHARDAVVAGDWGRALETSEAAAALCRGGLLDDLADHDWVATAAVRVDELSVECLENRLTALLALGRVADALTGAAALRDRAPLRDRACWLHMVALYRSGRGPDALDVYAEHAAHLGTELGLDPGPELRELQTLILRQAPELATWPRTAAWSGAADVSEPSVAVSVAPIKAVTAPGVPLVGRERELALLTAVLAHSAAGVPGWVALTGPAGIGKTRLAEEAARRAVGAQVVWVSCPDEPGIPPWWPMRQLVRALGADADAVLAVPAEADPDTARFGVYERIHLLLQSAGPLVLVIDDVQWADPASLGALAYVAGALRDRPVAVILTARDGEFPPGLHRLLDTLARRDRNRRMDVPALGADDIAALANGIAAEPSDRVDAAEAAVLAERTGGNPFFVSEYARLPRAQRASGDLPSAVKSVLDRRLGSLDPDVRQALRVAAVIGDSIDGSAIALLAETSGLGIDTLADHLDAAADARILVAAHGGGGYEFAHGLLREHLMAGMPPLRRQRLHARIAGQLSGRPEVAGRRAQHLIDALPLAEPREVVDACRVAAEHAAAQWSSETAARWWQAALDTYDAVPEADRDDAERDALLVSLLRALARAGRGQTVLDAAAVGLRAALRSGRASTVGRIAAELLRVCGGWPWVAPGVDPGEMLELLAGAVDVADPAAAARVRSALAVGQCYHPDPAVPARWLEQSAELAAATGDPDTVADALLGRLITYSGVPAFSVPTLTLVDELIALPHSRSREDAVIAHSVATMAAFDLGDIAAVQAHLRAGVAGSDELRLPVLRAQLRWMEAVSAIWHGDFAGARRHLDIARSGHEQTELYGAGSGLILLASLQREVGEPVDHAVMAAYTDTDFGGHGMLGMVGAATIATRPGPEAEDDAARLLGGQRADGHVWIGLGHATLLAHVCADHGLAGYAAELIERLDAHRREIALIGQIGIAGPVALATARLWALLGDRAAARRDLAVAEGVARRGDGAPSLLRISLLDCELRCADGEDIGHRAAELAADAERLGMRGVAAAVRRLVG